MYRISFDLHEHSCVMIICRNRTLFTQTQTANKQIRVHSASRRIATHRKLRHINPFAQFHAQVTFFSLHSRTTFIHSQKVNASVLCTWHCKDSLYFSVSFYHLMTLSPCLSSYQNMCLYVFCVCLPHIFMYY